MIAGMEGGSSAVLKGRVETGAYAVSTGKESAAGGMLGVAMIICEADLKVCSYDGLRNQEGPPVSGPS